MGSELLVRTVQRPPSACKPIQARAATVQHKSVHEHVDQTTSLQGAYAERKPPCHGMAENVVHTACKCVFTTQIFHMQVHERQIMPKRLVTGR